MTTEHKAHPTCMCPFKKKEGYCHPECMLVILMAPSQLKPVLVEEKKDGRE